MSKQNEIEFRVDDVIFDTAKSLVEMTYNTKSGYLLVWVSSDLMKIHQATKEWMDTTSYGQCVLVIKDFNTLSEIADCIKDKEWLCVVDDEDYDDDDDDSEGKPFKDESIKQAVLNRLYNAGTALGDFLEEKLKEGVFDDITDSEGWINFWKLICRVEDKYLDYRISNDFRMLMKDLANADSRFIIKEPDNETRRLMDGSYRSERPIEKYLITLRRGR